MAVNENGLFAFVHDQMIAVSSCEMRSGIEGKLKATRIQIQS